MMFSGVSLAGDVSFRTSPEVDMLAGTNLGESVRQIWSSMDPAGGNLPPRLRPHDGLYKARFHTYNL